MRGLLVGLLGGIAGLGVASAAMAGDAIPYPNSGSVNTGTYTFTATTTGDVKAYFVDGSGASFSNEVSLLVNGALSSNGFGLLNHTSQVGDVFDLGSVTAGDTLTFVMKNYFFNDPSDPSSAFAEVYSDPSLNGPYDSILNDDPTTEDSSATDGVQHIYSTAYTRNPAITPTGGNSAIPLGTYVAFEDIPVLDNPDFNYTDEAFVFTDTSINGVPTGGVPEPATWGLMLLGFGGLGAMMRRRRADLATA